MLRRDINRTCLKYYNEGLLENNVQKNQGKTQRMSKIPVAKLAEFKRKKNRSIKLSSPPNAVLSRVDEKSCPVDPGGTLSGPAKPVAAVKTTSTELPNYEKQVASQRENLPNKSVTSDCKTTITAESVPMMELASEHQAKDNHSLLISDNASTRPKIPSLQESSSSVDSFTLDRILDESEVSSSSDTITGISSDSTRSDSITENESTEISVPLSPEKNQKLASHFLLEDQNDNRPDEEKALESVPTSEKEKDVLVEEIVVSKEIIPESILSLSDKMPLEDSIEVESYSTCDESERTSTAVNVLMKSQPSFHSEDISASVPSFLNMTETEGEQVPVLNADEAELSTVLDCYQTKIKKYQDAIQMRDSVISKLSSTLESTMNANQAAHSAGNSQVESLRGELNLLQMKMKETAELFEKQKQKNGDLEFINCACQTDVLQLIKCDTGIQVETSINSLLQTCNLDTVSFIELFVNKFSTDSQSLHRFVQKLKENFSHVYIQELVTLLKEGNNTESIISENTGAIFNESDVQNCEKMDSALILKKITSLNMVAKLIESLVSISSSGANDTFSDFSPSKFQSFFLRRLHSMESGDILPDMSESESVVSDINYAEVETPGSKPPAAEPILSVEKLRKKNISEDFSLVTDFLQDEMDRLCCFIPSISSGPQGDGNESSEIIEGKESMFGANETNVESDHHKILLHKSKLETRLKNLKLLDRELSGIQQFPHQSSIDSDTMMMSEDNLLMEELPLSCISLLSLTDSEYKGDNITTDSETNFSRKVSLDMTRSMQEREFCIRCERNADLLREKYESDIMNLKDQLEKSFNLQKNNFLESIKSLETEIIQLKTEKENMNFEFTKQIELLCSQNDTKLKDLTTEYDSELSELKVSQCKADLEKDELTEKLKELQEKLTFSDKKVREILDEKANTEITLQKQIADLIEEHEQDLETMRHDYDTKLDLEKKHLENNHQTSIEILKNVQCQEINNLKCQLMKEFEDREKNLLNEHSKTISMMEAAHCDESALYQKRIENLLEEKCELLTKTTQEYETILKKNHRALNILCKRLLSKINIEKERILNESSKSNVDLDLSLSALEQLNNNLESGLVKFLSQNYFMNTNNEFSLDDTEYLPIEMSFPIEEEDILPKRGIKEFGDTSQKKDEKDGRRTTVESPAESRTAPSESSLDSDDFFTLQTELNRLQEEFQKDIAFYKDINDQLHLEIDSLKRKNQQLENYKENLEVQLQEKEKDLAAKESLLSAMDAAVVNHAAQTNSRLLHVLSDLVKTFLDIEQDINAHLHEYGLMPTQSEALTHQDDDTGQSVGSREDFTSLSLGECPNLELTEDGPDLTPRACDVFIPGGNYDTDLEGEDVVLFASRRLRLAVDHVLNLLSRALENQQNQDLKLLLKRNEELSHELQEESQGRDAVHMELVTAESTVRKLEAEKQRLEDFNKDLKDDFEMLKRELTLEKSKVSHLQQEKESALDEIHTLKEQCELLASRLGDPEKKNDKMLNSSGTCLHENSELLQENSRLSSEKQTVQKNLSKERQSFLDRLHQMENALEELNAEKEDLLETKCKEIRDLKAEMEAMEKQLQSNRRFIEQQALEREQEREEFMNKITKMEEFVKEKERIQSTESQLTKDIESLEELLRARIEDHKNVMAKKDEVEKELRDSVDKIRDLREVIDELEKQLDLKSRIEVELRQKLSNMCESIPNQDHTSSFSDSGDSSKHMRANAESMEQLHEGLKEQIASQSQEIEKMSQSQTLLHELRGQIHFLEAKVDQRARQLESSFLSAASSPVQSGATSPSGSQDSEPLQIPCEDGWEMSPRSIHWLEIRRLEDKIGKLAHIDEELLKKNKELEQQLKKIKISYSECQHENTALHEKLSEQLVQISALKSHIDEQKHRCSTPQKTHSFAEKIEELQESLEKQIENNKRLISDLQDAQTTISGLQDEIYKKDEMIVILQKCAENKNNRNTSDDENSELSIVEDLKNKLTEKGKLVCATEKENEELKCEVECLKTENASLKDLLKKSEEDVEVERAQVETLCEEIANLAETKKRLEEDYSTVQDMMQQKEKELATLHEETDDQMKLEAEIESLENKLSDQKNMELKLKKEIEELENQLSLSKSLRDEIENKELCIQNLKENHVKELENLNKQLTVLKKFSVVTENDADIEELVNKIMEAINVFKANEDNSFQEVLINLLRNTINGILKNLEQKHEEHISSVNKSWKDKVNEELMNKQSLFKSEAEKLKKKFHSEKEAIKAERDAFWQEKVNDIELKLMNQQTICKNLSESIKSGRNDLQAMYMDEITSLRQNLESALKEKLSLENTLKVFQAEVERLKKVENEQKNIISKEYETKLSSISKTIKESFESEKEKIVTSYQQKINTLQKELDLKLKEEQDAELKHKEELSAIHKYFETRWATEMEKIKDFQSEDLKKIKDNNEKILGDRLRRAKEEYSALVAEERKQVLQKHKQELEHVQEKCEREKKLLIEMKEKAVQDATSILEKKFNENLAEIQKNLVQSSHAAMQEQQNQGKWEEEKLKLISSHRKQLSVLKQELKNKYEKQLQAQLAAHNAEIKRLEETYNKQVEEVHELIKEAKRAASKTGYSDSGSNRTTTPSSDITSSDEACSSCQEDMLSTNRHILVDKIHQDGKRVLSLIESSAQPFASVKEAHLWLEERKWIVNRLKIVAPNTSNGNLKTVISDLVDEIHKFRMNFESALEENSELKQKCDDLEEQLNVQFSQLCDVSAQLKKQKATNLELESLLSHKISELSDIQRKFSEIKRLEQVPADKDALTPTNRSRTSSSHDIGCLRSADEPKSSEKFSLFLPEIDNTPSVELKTPSNKVSHIQELPPMPKCDISSVSIQSNSPPDAIDIASNETSEIKSRLLAVLNKGIDTTDAKLHGLYWVCRRSQSYNKALIYQKKYLLMLLRGFLGTEKVTLAWLKCLNSDNPSSPAGDGSITDSVLHPKSRFRAAAFVIIALQRMKFYVRRWRLLARIPSSHVINVEIQSVFQNYSSLSPVTSPGSYHLSSHSLSSVPMSLAGRDCKSSQMSTSSRAENKSKNNPDKSQLIEYVHRLEILQKQLGLDSLR